MERLEGKTACVFIISLHHPRTLGWRKLYFHLAYAKLICIVTLDKLHTNIALPLPTPLSTSPLLLQTVSPNTNESPGKVTFLTLTAERVLMIDGWLANKLWPSGPPNGAWLAMTTSSCQRRRMVARSTIGSCLNVLAMAPPPSESALSRLVQRKLTLSCPQGSARRSRVGAENGLQLR